MHRSLTALALSLSCSLLANTAGAQVWHVRADASPGGSGLSWADAFDDLQAGLDAAQAGHEVWVGAGTYRPGGPGSPRSSTFLVRSARTVYGGFAGHEGSLAERDRDANPTVLCGDQAGDDLADFVNTGENSFNVVTLLHDAELDGFTVRRGNANGGTYNEERGGGILHGRSRLRHLRVEENLAMRGGGVAAGTLAGTGGVQASLFDCAFRGNRATVEGGALYGGYVTIIERCTFTDNTADKGGAAIFAESPFELLHSVVRGNRSFGGSTFTRSAVCLFSLDASARISNSLIAGNVGHGLMLDTYSPAEISNTTIAHNTDRGVSWFPGGGEPQRIYNSIVWGNGVNDGAAGIWTFPSHSVYEDVFAAPWNQDPRFVDPLGTDGVLGTADDDYRLSCLSPYIDAGGNAAVGAGITTDLAGNPRFLDDPATPDTGAGTAPIVDLGPFEFVCDCDGIQSYCAAQPSTSGLPVSLSWSGSTSLWAGDLELIAEGGPALEFALFFYGPDATNLPFGDGVVCVAGGFYRLQLLGFDTQGRTSLALPFADPPLSLGPGQLLEGSQWHFQLAYRDPFGGPVGWNYSDALRVHFCR